MLKKMFGYFTLPLLLLFGTSWENSEAQFPGKSLDGQTGTLEKMIVGSGNVVMDLDLDRLKGISSSARESKRETVRFEVGPNSFFTIFVFNNELRGPAPGSMGLIWGNSAVLPEPLSASANQLVIEKMSPGEQFDLVVRDGKTGFVFFNIEGNLYELRCRRAFAQPQGRQTSDFPRAGEQAGAPGGCRRRSSGKFRSPRPCIRSKSPQSSTVLPNRRSCRGEARRRTAPLCQDLTSSWETCLPWSNLAAAEPRSVWRWERPPAITETWI